MISTHDKQLVVKANQRHAKDQGSTEVQIAILTERINSLQDHFKTHAKDHAGRRGLLLMVSKRNRLLRYIAESNREGYAALIKKLGLRK
jgi:small subunit ribosomal protein S15